MNKKQSPVMVKGQGGSNDLLYMQVLEQPTLILSQAACIQLSKRNVLWSVHEMQESDVRSNRTPARREMQYPAVAAVATAFGKIWTLTQHSKSIPS